MLLDTTAEIKNLDGNIFAAPHSSQENGLVPLTLGHVCSGALQAPLRIDPDSMEECEARVRLAEAISSADKVDITDKDVEMLILLINKTINLPVVVARAVGLLKEG